ncbi:FAD-linked oxidase C-terminal domain-containing protein [Sphingomonas quercus]|uniref:FAD-binding protein n=1 Tax=Sphingomonas quercus TaxID=2842451 RepID=A0ABS6BIS4_9SPHN|nr:FAD-linked oxidase C-terminal domain-containing protein [Sphingomonas quercus]MBU3078212.1 FAD-binding protein [Sphingomonas quercus]
MLMPVPDKAVMEGRDAFVAGLRVLIDDGLIEDPAELSAYSCDGLTAYQQLPLAVVLPRTVEEVSRILRYCHERDVKVVARGSGTSLSGGALPLADGIVMAMGRFNRILEIDYDDRVAVVQPGVTNLAISNAVAHRDFYYAPDPSSQIACSIGGNVAENAGGVHCLKYGMTSNNLLGLEMVLIDGTVVRLGGRGLDTPGYDLLGVVCGSEGMLGVVTEVTVRILPRPQVQRALLLGFATVEAAGNCVASIIGEGIIPAALEIMDRPAIHAAEDFVHAGYPLDVEALMIAELDGTPEEVDHLIAEVEAIALAAGASYAKASTSEAERVLFWTGRKAAFPAVGRISPDYYCVDGTIPRRTLGEVLNRITEIGGRHGLKVANVFHAGDGNLHPMVLYDSNIPGQLEAAEAVGAQILETCVEVGGVLSGEHGVGIEKRDLMHRQFGPADLEQQTRLKCAFDEKNLLNPGKVFPELCRCAEMGKIHVHRGALRFPELPRF